MGKRKVNTTKHKKANKADDDFLNTIIQQNNESNSSNMQSDQLLSTPHNIKKKIKLDKKYMNYPNVSICTPTFNRRPFFEGLIQCIKQQDYPHYKIEWIVVDDGTDSVRDIFEDPSFIESMGHIKVRYFYEPVKMDLGKKRNFMHQKCTFTRDDDVIVYMDDDDFYPPERVSHSVDMLMKHPKALCGGSSEIYLWFNTLNKMYKFGPYGPNHSTAGTFAFRRKLLKDTSYEDEAVLAEEKHFLKDYTVPFVQFDPLKTILVFSHEQNTFDKRRLINDQNKFCKESPLKVNAFIKDKNIENFYKNKIGSLIENYAPGDVKNKPKVLEEIARRDKERHEQANNRPSGIFLTNQSTGKPQELSMKELNEFIKKLIDDNKGMHTKLQEISIENNMLKQKLQALISEQITTSKSESTLYTIAHN